MTRSQQFDALLERHRWETRMGVYLFSALIIAAALTISFK